MSMYINAIAHYVPDDRLDNADIERLSGIDNETILRKTGIETRSRASADETTNTMAIRCANLLKQNGNVTFKNVDLIVGGSYTPFDTVGTIAHAVQQEFNIANARAMYVSAACSSFINCIEVVQGYFALGKSKEALVIVSEHNSAFNDETNPVSGHLWGDGAGAILISDKRKDTSGFEILDIKSKGHGDVGKGPDAVYCRMDGTGIGMPDGRNVFQNACVFMAETSEEILSRNSLSIKDVDYFIAHQANIRIVDYVVTELGIDPSKVLNNIQRLGNTGCASTAIVLSEHMDNYQPGDLILLTVFGGGYSSGSLLLRKL